MEIEAGYEYAVQCESTAPRYEPTRFPIFVDSPTEIVAENVERDSNGLSYAPNSDNSVIVFGQNGYHYVSLLNNSNEIAVVSDRSFVKSVAGCSTNHHLLAGPRVGNNLQVLVDCTDAEGTLIRQQVLIDYNDLNSAVPEVHTLHSPLSDRDRVSFSPQGTYILYTGTSRILLIRTSSSGTPGIMDFTGPVEASFLSENQLLVQVPGQYRIVVDIADYFATSFSGGKYELQDSAVHCPQGTCPPYVVDGSTLYLLSDDPSSQAYSVLSSYNLSDSSAAPAIIAKTLRTNVYSICFHTVANISVVPRTTPPPQATPPPQTPPPGYLPTTQPTTHRNTSPPAQPGAREQHPAIPVVGIVFIAIGAVAVLAVLCVYLTVGVYCCTKLSRTKYNLSHGQDTELQQMVVGGTLQPGPYSGGSTDSSANPSSAPSLEHLDNSNSNHTTTLPHPETVITHYVIPQSSVVSSGLAAPAQMVVTKS